jgi:hypothetical protein
VPVYVSPFGLAVLPDYFLLGQFFAGQRAQFSSSSFSMPYGIVSPHPQIHPSAVFVRKGPSQKGQLSMAA